MEPTTTTDKLMTDTEQATDVQAETRNPEAKKKEASYTYWV